VELVRPAGVEDETGQPRRKDGVAVADAVNGVGQLLAGIVFVSLINGIASVTESASPTTSIVAPSSLRTPAQKRGWSSTTTRPRDLGHSRSVLRPRAIDFDEHEGVLTIRYGLTLSLPPPCDTYRALRALHAWTRWGVWIFAVGGALWVLKVVFITLNDVMGRETDALPVPILYLSAILLMVVGATAVGIAVLRRFPWWAQLIGAIAAVVALWALYTVLDGILKPTFEGVGPSWLHEELGILVTGAICVVVGVVLARRIAERPAPAY
jgi:hypothetical protein